jgi:hypothetical protein
MFHPFFRRGDPSPRIGRFAAYGDPKPFSAGKLHREDRSASGWFDAEIVRHVLE